LTVSVTVCEWVKAPDVPVIVKVYVSRFVCGLFDPQPARTMKRIMAVAMASRIRSCRVLRSRNSSSNARNSGTICRIDPGGMRVVGGGTISAVVVTVTVDVTGAPLGVTEDGDAVHVDNVNAGGSVQVSATAELNPLIGVTVAV
jgi:hypothetical protein